jgi:hypothetical protein
LSKTPLGHNAGGRLAVEYRPPADHRSELMALSAFHDETRLPTEDAMRSVLGNAYAMWAQLLAAVAERIGPVTEVWKYTSLSTGWGLRVIQKDRVILYMTPQQNQFIVSFALGERAVAAARAARLSARVLEAIDAAPTYAEGRGVRIPVRDNRYLRTLTRLAQIKCELSR